jgi:Flp pilus assembly pilin Flp
MNLNDTQLTANQNSLQKSRAGQGLVEYALLLVLVGIVVITSLRLLGEEIRDAFCEIVAELDPNAGQECGDPITFTLVNADSNQDIQSLEDGDVITLSSLPTTNLSIRADTRVDGVNSVRFGLDANGNFRTESIAPYAIAGDVSGDYAPWTPGVGSHTLTGTAFSATGGGGDMLGAVTISFRVNN